MLHLVHRGYYYNNLGKGSLNMESINYEGSGVNIETANNVKKQFENIVSTDAFAHCTPINKVGAFAYLI